MPKPRPPKRMTPEALESAAVTYLARFTTSAANLKRVLAGKALRSARHYGEDPAPLVAAADAIVSRYVAQGAIDDELYAETRLATFRRRGASSRAIRSRLAAKGLDAVTIEHVLVGTESAPQADLRAAIILARRRRLGPFRASARAENRTRDLAVLGRAGFDYATAALVIDVTEPDALFANSGD